MRLPATGFTLPWQLVAAQEPGPMYLDCSGVSVEADKAGSKQKDKTARIRAGCAMPGLS
jgi:hypothetical protein